MMDRNLDGTNRSSQYYSDDADEEDEEEEGTPSPARRTSNFVPRTRRRRTSASGSSTSAPSSPPLPPTSPQPSSPPPLLCSVLATVVDHVMIDPTPLEPEEFFRGGGDDDDAQANAAAAICRREGQQQNQQQQKVPVLRIFGPILRRDDGTYGSNVAATEAQEEEDDDDDPPQSPPPRQQEQQQQYQQLQSACLYVHGAFPYLLARPVVAGPDGSLYRRCRSRRRSRRRSIEHDNDDIEEEDDDEFEYADWDDAASVRRMIPILHEALEAKIQSSRSPIFSDDGGGGEKQRQSKQSSRSTTTKVVRRIEVKLGRGFYTYCPGPAAPFLRIEYYDPSDRWRVKAALERGLDDLPGRCNPDPLQYRPYGSNFAHGDDVQRPPDDTTEGLKFNCYEAHIPYTMQFFKDWNLAGASYVHLSRGLFRAPLRASIRSRWKGQRTEGRFIDSGRLFLDSNTPEHLVWKKSGESDDDIMSVEDYVAETDTPNSSQFEQLVPLKQPSQQSSAAANDSDDGGSDPLDETIPACPVFEPSPHNGPGPWSKKCTSCEVEIDVHVQDILNINEVMTELPLSISERQSTHWRAVPSLREMWQEERRRMAKLLRPQDDFLSRSPEPATPNRRNSPVPFTLNVKKDARLPGGRLACEGMHRLVEVSEGLAENFRRAMNDIVKRHDDEITRIDQVFGGRESSAASDTGSGNRQSDELTPSTTEALQALEALGRDADEPAKMNGISTPQYSQQSQISVTSRSSELKRSGLLTQESVASSSLKSRLSQDERFHLSAQAYYQTQSPMPQSDREIDDFEMSQRVDRGDSVVQGPFQHVEDFIDHETLLPHEAIDEGDADGSEDDDDEGPQMIERTLQTLATQMFDGSHGYDDVVNRSFKDKMSSFGSTQGGGGQIFQSERALDNLKTDADVEEQATTCEGSAWLHQSEVFIEQQRQPPRYKDLSNASSSALRPMEARGGPPSWISYAVEYERLRRGSASNDDRFPPVAPPGITIEPTCTAPTRGAVTLWSRKSLKRRRSRERVDAVAKRLKRRNAKPKLHLDENSRKLVAVTDDMDGCMHEEDDVDQIPLSALSSSSKGTTEDGTPLKGIGNQGGKIWVEGGGHLKAKTRPTQQRPYFDESVSSPDSRRNKYLPAPVTLMIIEVHVQCRIGHAAAGDSNEIAMTPDPERDRIFAVVFVYGQDPGGGEPLQVLERGCLLVPVEAEMRRMDFDKEGASYLASLSRATEDCMPSSVMGFTSPLTIECVKDERSLLLRIASIVRGKDPDMLLSWDTQGGGLGYIIERGATLGKNTRGDKSSADASEGIDMAKLMGRTPTVGCKNDAFEIGGPLENGKGGEALGGPQKEKGRWKGSGLGEDWDERVGPGAAAASIVGRLVFAGWKIVAEEVKHPNASYLQAVVSTVLGKRIPYHDNIKLTGWYSHNRGRERWRVLHHKLTQAVACLLMFDQLDIIGRAGEAARLSGVEFSQSFPGIRGSQYKVEGVLLRALQSLNSEERGSKKGKTRRPEQSSRGSSSLSYESKSQTQSPWKARRRAIGAEGGAVTHEEPDSGYFFFSPSTSDTNQQEALQVQALTMEPVSGHYQDPVVVCDFTALYPSLVIGYNLCYSTVAGTLEYHSTRLEMQREGRTTGRVGPFQYSEARTATVLKHHMKSLHESEVREDRAYVAPTGTIYVSEAVVKGVLPQVLDELLSTRAMLKKAAKEYKKHVPGLSPSILRQLEARQLALKYVANVTYGTYAV